MAVYHFYFKARDCDRYRGVLVWRCRLSATTKEQKEDEKGDLTLLRALNGII